MTSKPYNTYQFILITLFVSIVLNYLRQSLLPIGKEAKILLGYPGDSLLNFTELTAQYGYVSEEHRVITEDGYILTMFRIVQAKNCRGKKRSVPILLMHGLLQSSDSMIDAVTSAGLPYLISDECYDVWVGNFRGNYYSRSHISLDPDINVSYWLFDINEFGKFDVPAMIDHILDLTDADKLNYVGYSQGAAAFFVMCSERPEYCGKANVMIGLGPSSRLINMKSVVFRTILAAMVKLEGLMFKLGVGEVFAKGAIGQESVEFLCGISNWTLSVCNRGLLRTEFVDGFNYGAITYETTRNMLAHIPAGTSWRNIARYGQNLHSPRFEKYDHGVEKNLIVYGSDKPPEYNLIAVTVPFVCIYGKNDGLVDTGDVKWLLSQLPNVVDVLEVKNPLWHHFDMVYSQYVGELVFPKINESLYKFSQT